jgi:hypothetical protein
MDQNKRDLIIQLCSCAGVMMEDASVPAVTAAATEEGDLPSMLSALMLQVRQISTLLAAAAALTDSAQT